MSVIEIAKIQVRRGQELQTGVPQLDPGEFGWAQDTQHLYIGKRIVEGANSDENSRILTEPDLQNIFNLINSTSSNILKYQYRDDIEYFRTRTAVRNVSDKLDEYVSIVDFGAVPGVTGDDITQVLEDAITALYADDRGPWYSNEVADNRRQLKIPAGHYVVSDLITLPPKTMLVGEGSGLTRITFNNSTTSLFATVDAEGNNWNSSAMSSGVKRSKDVLIKGMTLEYLPTAASNNPLIRLDNVLNVMIEDVELRTAVNSTSTTTFGLVNQGIGIAIRGEGGGIGAGDSNLCENVQIKNCRFDSLLIGIEGTGSVIRSLIQNNIFNNLDQGIKLYTIDSTPAPNNFYVLENRFQNIVKEGIYVGTDSLPSNHISENNFFIQVGNGTTLDDTTSSTASSVISFLSPGNASINDHFQRKVVADSTATTSTFYYNPLVNGPSIVVDDKIYVKTLETSNQLVAKFALSPDDQSLDVNYKLYSSNHGYIRTGKLLVNIASGTLGESSPGILSDYYNFSAEGTLWPFGDPDSPAFSISTVTNNYVKLEFNNWSTSTLNIEYQVSRTA